MNMVERVARALARHDNPKHENWWPSYERRARAAIAAMREPTEAMELAAFGGDSLELGSSAYGCWKDMLDAALMEGDNG